MDRQSWTEMALGAQTQPVCFSSNYIEQKIIDSVTINILNKIYTMRSRIKKNTFPYTNEQKLEQRDPQLLLPINIR